MTLTGNAWYNKIEIKRRYIRNEKILMFSIGDNMVGFLSQIGWIGDSSIFGTPHPEIQMEKIFVDVDTNGGNGGEKFIWEAVWEGVFKNVILHSKIPHRIPVVEKTAQFLGEEI